MDKKTLSGLLVIAVILFGFSWYSNRNQKKLAQEKQTADSIYRAQHPVQEVDTLPDTLAQANPDPLQQQAASQKADSIVAAHVGGSLFAATKGEEQFYTLENNKLKLTLSNRGGRVAAVELKEYKRYNKDKSVQEPLMLFDETSSKFDAKFFLRNQYGDSQINTGDYYFALPEGSRSVVVTDTTSVSLRLYVDSTAYLEYVYTLSADDYMVDFDMNFVGMGSHLSNQSDFLIEWGSVARQNEKGFENENTYSDLAYMFPGEDKMEHLGLSKETKEESVKNKIKWIGFKQQFFSSVLIASDAFASADLRYDTYLPGSGKIKKYDAKISVPFSPQVTGYDFKYYFGPNKFSVLKKYDEHLEKLVPLGWGIFGWINRYIVIPTFDFLGRGINSFGIIILLLTIFIKLIIFPMTYKSYLSSAKMRLLKPEIDELGAKYPKQEDMAKKQQATMELYKKAGVSPMGGCLPMLIQMPFLIAMFRFFPAAIEFRGESFLWADDLSSFDSIINLPFSIPFYGNHVSLFALMMAVTMYFSTRLSMNQTMQAGPQMAGMKFMSLYLMPVMMLVWFNNYASALTYYYTVSSLITIGQTIAFRYVVDDEKLHQQMKENAKKPRKKSKWTARYENILKEQQRQQRETAAKRAKR